MKILLICANGLSTSILMNKMQKWGKEKNIELEVRAVPMSEYLNVFLLVHKFLINITKLKLMQLMCL